MIVPKFRYLDHPGFIALAHRGGEDVAPENTMAAFAHAVSIGYRYIETDVHATKDHKLIAFHDDILDRVTDQRGVIAQLTWDEIRQAKIAGVHDIPLLDDLFHHFPNTRLNIDPKSDAAAHLLPEVIRRHAAIERVGFGSFSDARLTFLRKELGPQTCTSMGPLETGRLRFHAWGMPTWDFAAGCAQIPEVQYGIRLVDQRLIEAAHRRQLQVHVWTINDEADMRRLIDWGVDGIVTDRPTLLKKILIEKSLWVNA